MEEKNRAYVERMLEGDEAAFDQLYHSYSGRLYRMAYFITGSRSDSEDILQETFVKCFLHRKELRQPDRFESWLYQILVHTAWRTNRKRKDLSYDSILENESDTGMAKRICKDNSDGPLEHFLNQERSLELLKAVQSLDIKYRTVILLHYYMEMQTKDIAHITGILEGTVKSRLFKARQLLKQKLEPTSPAAPPITVKNNNPSERRL